MSISYVSLMCSYGLYCLFCTLSFCLSVHASVHSSIIVCRSFWKISPCLYVLKNRSCIFHIWYGYSLGQALSDDYHCWAQIDCDLNLRAWMSARGMEFSEAPLSEASLDQACSADYQCWLPSNFDIDQDLRPWISSEGMGFSEAHCVYLWFIWPLLHWVILLCPQFEWSEAFHLSVFFCLSVSKLYPCPSLLKYTIHSIHIE